MPNGAKVEYMHDHLERVTGIIVKNTTGNSVYTGSTYEYSSGNGANTTSDTIDKVTLNVTNSQYSYVYDDCNNITEIYKNNALIRKYTYDDLQQMTREIIIESGATTGKQYDFEYDLYGNILSKTESTYTVATGAITGSATAQFSYTDSTWKDLLTSRGNMSFTYDEIGNLRSLKNGSNTSGYYFNWGKGRQLESLAFGETAESAEVYVEYGYNADGIRISRTFNVGGLEYIVDGDKILKQVGCGVGVLQTLEFYYDALGEIIGFNYANQDYYFGKNLQGDVVELYQDGTLIATYEYDAWGKLLSIKDANGVTIADDINSTHVAVINPIRYRGYYYDIEKKMYYLNSRYYYPTIGRFISADGYVSTGQDILGTNMFAYCLNNPVNMLDKSGSCARFVEMIINSIRSIFRKIKTAVSNYIEQNVVIHHSNEMDVCTDGFMDNGHNYGDKSHIGATALFGDKISADKVNYMVVPTGHPEYSSLLGCVGVVRNNDTGEFVYAVVCEGGPSESSDWYGESAWDEVSIKVAWELNGHPYGSHIANERQYGNFSYFIFKKSKRDWNPSNDMQEEIDIIASKYWRLK